MTVQEEAFDRHHRKPVCFIRLLKETSTHGCYRNETVECVFSAFIFDSDSAGWVSEYRVIFIV